MRRLLVVSATTALVSASLAINPANAGRQAPLRLDTSTLSAQFQVSNARFDGPDCTQTPFTVGYTKRGEATRVGGILDVVYDQRGSNALTGISVRINAEDPPSGRKQSFMELCPAQFRGESTKVNVSLSLRATVDGQSSSTKASISFWVARARTVVSEFRASTGRAYGKIQGQTKRLGNIGAEGKVAVWYRKPGDRLFTRLGASQLDRFGRFSVPTRGQVPNGSLLKISFTGCSWCRDAYAETRLGTQPTKTATRYYRPPYYPGYTAVRFSRQGRKVQAVWQGDGPGDCFVGQRIANDRYRGAQYNLAGGKRQVTYQRSHFVSGKRVKPPTWFKKSSARAFSTRRCS